MEMLHVAVAVLADETGRILIARRHEDAHQGGLWEFPGGKVDPGEGLADALRRECHEELGVEIQAHRPLIRIRHDYPDRSVLLDVHRITAYRGEPRGLEGQPLAWVTAAALVDYPMPAADVPIVNAIRLPERYLITPSLVGDRFVFEDALQASLERGVRLVQFRVRAATDPQRRLAEEALRLCHAAGARLLINRDPALARDLGADGVHLQAAQLRELADRPEGLAWVAASCHDAGELALASALQVDFAVLSPVRPTASHPDAGPLGWEAFTSLLQQVNLPVYALGGVGPADLERAWQAGAQGVAGISELWGNGRS